MIPPHKVAEAMWRENEASRALGMKLEEVGPGSVRDSAFGYACNTHNQRTVSASASIDYVARAFVEDRLTAEAREVERQERRAIHDVKVVNQKGETVALLRGTSASVKGKWI